MPKKSVIERLTELNPETEIWWDSSPLLYAGWKQQMLAKSPPEARVEWDAQLTRLFSETGPAASLIRGVTTNPPISLQTIEGRPDIWLPWVDALIHDNPTAGVEAVFWRTYLEMIRRGSEMMKPIWEVTNHRFGYLSGQVDPRYPMDEDLMFKQALELASQNPNVMIKCPGTAEGIRVLRRLTAMGIATNCTVAFTVPQFLAVMDAVQAGLAEAETNAVSLFRWRSVITHMAARYEEREAFTESAASVGVKLTLEDKRWASIAIFRQGYKLGRKRRYPGKLLFCSVRPGPVVDGVERYWHIEQVAGGSMVYTLPPDSLAYLWEHEANLSFRPTIEEDIPAKTMEKLMGIPYFAEAYGEEMEPARFATLPPTVFTIGQFSKATGKMVDFVAQRIAAVRGQ